MPSVRNPLHPRTLWTVGRSPLPSTLAYPIAHSSVILRTLLRKDGVSTLSQLKTPKFCQNQRWLQDSTPVPH